MNHIGISCMDGRNLSVDAARPSGNVFPWKRCGWREVSYTGLAIDTTSGGGAALGAITITVTLIVVISVVEIRFSDRVQDHSYDILPLQFLNGFAGDFQRGRSGPHHQ